MSRSLRIITGSFALFVLFAFVASASAQVAITAADSKAIVKAMDDAMDPGDGQKRLDFMVGTFDVKVKVWINPGEPPIESTATAVASWVLGHRYIQQMLSGFIMGEAWNGIGYAGYDNVQGQYVACYMDTGSTGMEWYTGNMDPDGKSAKLTATIADAITLKPTKLEMRLTMSKDGNHVTELWQQDLGGRMFESMELTYIRKKS